MQSFELISHIPRISPKLCRDAPTLSLREYVNRTFTVHDTSRTGPRADRRALRSPGGNATSRGIFRARRRSDDTATYQLWKTICGRRYTYLRILEADMLGAGLFLLLDTLDHSVLSYC